MFRRSLGPVSGSTPRRGRPPRRPAQAIERLEERMLLSAATYDRFENVNVAFSGAEFSPWGGWPQDSFPVGVSGYRGEVVAAFLFWEGVDLTAEGGDGVYDVQTVSFDGVELQATLIGSGDTSGRGEGGAAKYRIDVSSLYRNGIDGSHVVAGLVSQPGHRVDRFQSVVLYRDLGRSGGWQGTTLDVQSGGNGADGLGYAPLPYHRVFSRPSDATFLALTSGEGDVALSGSLWWRSDLFEIVSPPEAGELAEAVDANGRDQLLYRPPAGFIGETSFRFRIRTYFGYSDPATATIVVRPDSPPVANDFTYVVKGPFTGHLAGHDPDGQGFTFEIVDPPAIGTFSYDGDASFDYSPPEGFSGLVEFTYRARHGGIVGELATVKLHVFQSRAADLDITIFSRDGGRTATRLSGSNGRPFDRYELVSPPVVGRVEFFPGMDDGIKYLPPAGFLGRVTFAYRAWDGYTWTNAATVTVSVVPDTPPVITDVRLSARGGEAVVGRLSGHDAEGDPFTYVAEPPAIGALQVNPWSGEFVYTPPAGFSGVVTFRYGIVALDEWSELKQVTIDVEAPNKAPAVADVKLDSKSTREIRGEFGGYDQDGDPLSYEVVTPPEIGTVEIDGNRFVWRRAGGWGAGGRPRSITFTYRAWDGTTFSAPATVTISFRGSEASSDGPPASPPPTASAILNLLTSTFSTLNRGGETRLTATAVATVTRMFTASATPAAPSRPALGTLSPPPLASSAPALTHDSAGSQDHRSSVFELDWTELWDRQDTGLFAAGSPRGALGRTF